MLDIPTLTNGGALAAALLSLALLLVRYTRPACQSCGRRRPLVSTHTGAQLCHRCVIAFMREAGLIVSPR